jgi:hypothetical protein
LFKERVLATVQQTFNLTVTADTEKPKVALTASANRVQVGTPVTFRVQATDNIRVANLQLLVNNQPQILDARGMATVTLADAGAIAARAIATDSAGNQEQSELTVQVSAIDSAAPVVSLNLSGIPDGVVTAATDIFGTVSDDNLVSYKLEAALVGTDDFRLVAQGNTTVTNGVLGKFDPSLLENDTYTLRLTAEDVGGNISVVEETLSVAGELKLGNSRFA